MSWIGIDDILSSDRFSEEQAQNIEQIMLDYQKVLIQQFGLVVSYDFEYQHDASQIAANMLEKLFEYYSLGRRNWKEYTNEDDDISKIDDAKFWISYSETWKNSIQALWQFIYLSMPKFV